MSTPEPDRAQIFAALKILHPRVAGFVEVLALQPDDGRLAVAKFCTTVEQAAVVAFMAATHPATRGRNILAGVASRRVMAGTLDDLGHTLAAWADVDMRTPAERADRLRRAKKLPRPTLTVNTSEVGQQSYWLAEKPLDLSNERGVERLRHINVSLADALGLERNAAVSPHMPLKLPGTINRMTAAKRAAGRDDVLVTIEDYRPECVVPWSDWRKLFGDPPPPPKRAPISSSEHDALGLAELMTRFGASDVRRLNERHFAQIDFDETKLPASVERLLSINPFVRAVFERRGRWGSESECDFALVCALAKRRVLDVRELAAAQAISRERRGAEAKRPAIYVRTAARALAAVLQQQAKGREENEPKRGWRQA